MPSALFLVQGRHQPASRIRVLQYLPLLERDGWKTTARSCISGAAPLALHTLEKFEAALGVPLLEGYGLTETSPVVAANRPRARKMDGSGRCRRRWAPRLRGEGVVVCR